MLAADAMVNERTSIALGQKIAVLVLCHYEEAVFVTYVRGVKLLSYLAQRAPAGERRWS